MFSYLYKYMYMNKYMYIHICKDRRALIEKLWIAALHLH